MSRIVGSSVWSATRASGGTRLDRTFCGDQKSHTVARTFPACSFLCFIPWGVTKSGGIGTR
ncbi:MAG: hypothetical protein ACK58T_04835, partial [Phycisphaerae bacterium]